MYTEEEAKVKWCPMGRVSASSEGDTQGTTINRMDNHVGTVDFTNCLASSCMMWRWVMLCNGNDTLQHPTRIIPIYEQTEKGYCGLAGGIVNVR